MRSLRMEEAWGQEGFTGRQRPVPQLPPRGDRARRGHVPPQVSQVSQSRDRHLRTEWGLGGGTASLAGGSS